MTHLSLLLHRGGGCPPGRHRRGPQSDVRRHHHCRRCTGAVHRGDGPARAYQRLHRWLVRVLISRYIRYVRPNFSFRRWPRGNLGGYSVRHVVLPGHRRRSDGCRRGEGPGAIGSEGDRRRNDDLAGGGYHDDGGGAGRREHWRRGGVGQPAGSRP